MIHVLIGIVVILAAAGVICWLIGKIPGSDKVLFYLIRPTDKDEEN